MRITRARFEFVNEWGHPEGTQIAIEASPKAVKRPKPGHADVEMSVRPDLRNQATIYRETYDPERAADLGYEGPWVRTDWFVVHDSTIEWHGDYIWLTGYMKGYLGIMRDGVSPRTGRKPNSFSEEDGEPFVRVRVELS